MKFSRIMMVALPLLLTALACSKKGTGPEEARNLVLSGTSLDFGEVGIGEVKDIILTVSNDAASAGAINGKIELSGTAFALVDVNVSFNLSPGESREFGIRFRPESEASFSGTIKMTHTANNQPTPLQIPLAGSGNDLTDEIQAMLLEGWQDFEAGDYPAADARFDEALMKANLNSLYSALVPQAEVGRGWTKAYRRDFGNAKALLLQAVDRFQADAGTKLDAKAGLALVYLALNEYSSALARALEVLASPGYSFAHDTRVNVRRMRLLAAQAYFSLGNYQGAAGQLDILAPAQAPHAIDPGVLLGQIQELWATT